MFFAYHTVADNIADPHTYYTDKIEVYLGEYIEEPNIDVGEFDYCDNRALFSYISYVNEYTKFHKLCSI